ncbi:hypothetical protein AQZ52_03525 [Novosphingobium fuchskuhlense]|uniref:Uncharacterized protein n=2 Tax=Novosphingobium fuchskuhlense TaxID=1117702 RepID=A0A124JVJ1_9SPHN|nr:hypothetical protein AQZ52_03525 [Novosphingobium fuchskuhlense]
MAAAAALAALVLQAPLAQAADVNGAAGKADAKATAEAARAAEREEAKRLGSYYLRCDGEPNNVTGAEDFARFLGAVTLLGLFAPTPESPDPSKRLFGAKGVEACSHLLDDPKEETNKVRRIPLILARALHQIEAKNYAAALADVDKARAEAQSSGLSGNAYFERSAGLSFGLIEGHARLRAGDPAGAREAGLRSFSKTPYSYYALIAANAFAAFNRDLSPAEESYYQALSRLVPGDNSMYAARLEEVGRFEDAARLREAQITLARALSTERDNPALLAYAAIAHALAGHWDEATKRANAAQATLDEQAAAGKPADNASAVIELLDFASTLQLAHSGKVDDARRNFAARSQWMAPSFGAVSAAVTMLRSGAKPEQLFGALAVTADAMWQKRRDLILAQMLEMDTNNRKLFSYILPYARIRGFEALSKSVWRTDKPRFLFKEPLKNSKFTLMTVDGEPLTQPDALTLNAALLAKARGFKGFVLLRRTEKPDVALVQFGNVDDPAIAAPMWLDAEAVIADLRAEIPSPDELAARARNEAALKKPQ